MNDYDDARGGQKSGSRQTIQRSYTGSLHLLRQQTREGDGVDQPGGGVGAGAHGDY